MTYDRAKALAYARKYWTKSCSDGYVGVRETTPYVKVPNGTVFVRTDTNETAHLPDGKVVDNVDDCAHFLSCCLGHEANEAGGGLPIQRDFPSAIYGVISARRLFSTLTEDGLIESILQKASHDQTAHKLSQLAAGDLIFYWDPSVNAYGHSAMYLADAKKRIACHTRCRCDQSNEAGQEWDSVAIPNVSYTLARVRDAAPLVA
ncbi:amidase domain-containing protein [Bradyrhizobium diazoefficiens]|nr:amidase domain-containing protein [Bradyrhizobium diazoefficiens]QQN65259.1 amidase domain-containing protein [Bradyrhizobium diazoefficiens]